jgi:hypothetical protein
MDACGAGGPAILFQADSYVALKGKQKGESRAFFLILILPNSLLELCAESFWWFSGKICYFPSFLLFLIQCI